MQLEANESHKSKRILVRLVEEALLEYERNLAERDDDSTKDCHLNHLFLQLKALLGDVLVEALSILDEQSILLYTFGNSKIVEIQIKRQQCKSSIWLFPYVNYCTCKQFKVGVLRLADDELHTLSATRQNEKLQNRFTCAHVLALRLAQVLHPPPLTYKVETVTEHQHKALQDRMYYSYLEALN